MVFSHGYQVFEEGNQKKLRIKFGDNLKLGAIKEFCIESKYENTARNPRIEFAHMQVHYPTNKLTLIAIFPKNKPFKGVPRVWIEKRGKEARKSRIQPKVHMPGRMFIWKQRFLPPNCDIKFEWDW